MSGPSVYLTLPSWELLKFPPDPLPNTLPPPTHERTLRSPFGIHPWLYNATMHPAVPFGVAIAYIIVVLSTNAYNRSRGNKPWWISQQRIFKLFMIVHNIGLALYSLATCVAMFRAAAHSIPSLTADGGAAGLADALCKLHGPRSLGDAVTYNSTINIWESKNQLIRITGLGSPDPTDVGRLWNEGLAFWGWIFYLSKFYEVIDTFLIVAKGKESKRLQTYHHSGAMLCMWAGIRYMSPPIWMFVFVNSGIHTLMYFYYALDSMGIKVSKRAKQSLTTLQIIQLVWGATYAGMHLFIAYDIPVATPYKVAAKVAAVASSASSAFASATSVVSAAIESPTFAKWSELSLKKLLLRAAGEEGAAERLGSPVEKPFVNAIESKFEEVKERVFHQPTYETKWRTEYTRVNCIDTSGEAFAILLNLCYLAPLFVLFVRFFIRSYLSHGRPKTVSEATDKVKKDAKTAKDETERTVEKAGKRAEDAIKNGAEKGKETVTDAKEQLNTPRRGDSAKEDAKSPESAASSSEQSPEKKKKKKNKHKNKDKHDDTKTADESEDKQDAVLSATEPVRPAPEEEDTDAMGQSGVGVVPTDPEAPSYAAVADPETKTE